MRCLTGLVMVMIMAQFLHCELMLCQVFESSNLPIVVINTDGKVIQDEKKINVHMGISHQASGNRSFLSDSFNIYEGNIGIEFRGKSTNADKAHYLIETRTPEGENLNVSLLGMPEENDWILRPLIFDKSLMRNSIASYMARRMGNYAFRNCFVELLVDGEYQGVYLLTEKIKWDRNRVNITKMVPDDEGKMAITGGYIYELNGWYYKNDPEETFGKMRGYSYPRKGDITPGQSDYIEAYDDAFRAVMKSDNVGDPISGYPAWIDVNAFVDEMIIQEACKNADAYGWSCFFHKDRLKKLAAGPIWDFDQALGGSVWLDAHLPEGWKVDTLDPYSAIPTFWKILFHDPTFAQLVKKRWEKLRERELQSDSLLHFLDSLSIHLREAQERNYQRWPEQLGKQVWRDPPGAEERDTWEKEVDYLRNWLMTRLGWMDQALSEINGISPAIPTLSISQICFRAYGERDNTFIEIVNHGTATADLSQVYFNRGITYTFPDGSLLAPGACLTLSGNASDFEKQYDFLPFDEFYKKLDDQGEMIELNNSFGQIIDFVDYGTNDPWPLIDADHPGVLQRIKLAEDANDPLNWVRSADSTGNPCQSTTVLPISDFIPVRISVFPNPFTDKLFIEGDWKDLKQIRIVEYNGRVLYQRSYEDGISLTAPLELDLSSLPDGLFLVIMSGRNKVYSRKVIKQ